jgi:hypothetical protein
VSWIDQRFPAPVSRYVITSEPDPTYNCIAYAVGVTTEWWSDLPGYKWPAARGPHVEALVAVFAGRGFTQCASGELESGHEKVAVFAKAGAWTHAAWQTHAGRWRSKLGQEEDIEHQTPDCLCGDAYGAVHCFMKRVRAEA